MASVSISLPAKLKLQAETLVKEGYYVSLSDVVRAGLRGLIRQSKYDLWTKEAKDDLRRGKALVLNDAADIEKLFKK